MGGDDKKEGLLRMCKAPAGPTLLLNPTHTPLAARCVRLFYTLRDAGDKGATLRQAKNDNGVSGAPRGQRGADFVCQVRCVLCYVVLPVCLCVRVGSFCLL